MSNNDIFFISFNFYFPMKTSSIFAKFTLFTTLIIILNLFSVSFGFIDEQEINKLLKEETLDNVDTNNVDANFDTKPTTSEKDTIAVWTTSEKHAVADIQPVYQQETKKEVINRMYKNWLTSFWSVATFKPDNFITREQMSKFSVTFALMVNKQRNVNPSCGFKDIYKWEKTLIPYLLSACNMSIIKGSKWYASPTKSLTKAEAITIIMRLIRNDISTNANPWYKNSYNIAKAYWITHDSIKNMNNKTTRREVAVMLYRAYKFLKE